MSRRREALVAALVAGTLLAPLVTSRPPLGPPLVSVSVARQARPADVATGFAAGRGRAVTVAHVLDGGGRVTVRGADGVARRALPVRIDRRHDLAVLAVPGLGGPPARVGAATAGAHLLVRRPGGVEAVPAHVRRGIVAHVHGAAGEPVRVRPAVELRADVEVGDSGAPLVTTGGRVAGVLYARSAVRPSTAYAVRVEGIGALAGR